ncbi:Plant self-incompatibility S1 [Arabidopsis suecica]|uniref:S-protein homolog n=1 Tax=Arabidopsis suecica TaxID=45249 RepID=A0A8T2DD60_ARASU|nr:Plant self-incompatibility S1 [Arabidopsis suecica]
MINSSSKKNLISTFSSMFTICIVMIFVTCYETFQQDGEPFPIRGPLTRITVKNNNDYLLEIHCKSKDDDLGFHILKEGELYGWKFHVNFQNSTLYFCGFSQGQDNKGVFDIYRAERDFYRCRNCTWDAKKDSLYGYSNLPQTVTWFFKWLK